MTKTKAFGKILKRLRLKKSLTQESLGFEAGLSRVYIGELENGKKTPTLETLHKLSMVLNIKCSKVLELIEEEFL
jgi:hypothetical protein